MNFIADNRTSGSVAAATVVSGAGQWMNWVPDDIGKLATLLGVILTIVMIAVQVNKVIWDNKKNKNFLIEQELRIKKMERAGASRPADN